MANMTIGALRNHEIDEKDIKAAEQRGFARDEFEKVLEFEKGIIGSGGIRQIGPGRCRLLAKLQFLEEQNELPSQKE